MQKKIDDDYFTFIDDYDVIIPFYLPYMSVSGLTLVVEGLWLRHLKKKTDTYEAKVNCCL